MDEERALSQHVPDNLLQVLVIVKRPLLALRYTLPDGQIRKTQMNFVPFSGCDVALGSFRAAGLPIRDKDLPQVQSQLPQLSQSQPHSQERPGSSNVDPYHVAHSQSGQSVFPDSAQPLSQGITIGQKATYGSIPPCAQLITANIRPTSAPSAVKQHGPNGPISASTQSTLNVFGSPITITSLPTVTKPRVQSGLLPSPVFNGTYEPFGSFNSRPMSAPEQTQIQQEYTITPPLSQMLPPERTFAFPEKMINPFPLSVDEAESQDDPARGRAAVTKIKAKRQTKPRAQPAKPRKSRGNIQQITTSSEPLAPSSPSPAFRVPEKDPVPGGPSRIATPEIRATPPTSESLAVPSPNYCKRPLSDQSLNQPNKRQAQTRAKTVTEDVTESLQRKAVTVEAPQARSPEMTDPFVNIANYAVLESIDDLMRKYDDHPAPRYSSRTSKDYLADYAAQAEEDRVKAIDNLICQCIQDESFVKLMEDLEGAWKRIGLGV